MDQISRSSNSRPATLLRMALFVPGLLATGLPLRAQNAAEFRRFAVVLVSIEAVPGVSTHLPVVAIDAHPMDGTMTETTAGRPPRMSQTGRLGSTWAVIRVSDPSGPPFHGGDSGERAQPFLTPDLDPGNRLLDRRTTAGLWSWLIPGGGQFYNGETGKGALMLGAFTASIIYAVAAGIGEGEICNGPVGLIERSCMTVPYEVNRRFFIGFGSAAAVHVWSVLDAIRKR